MDVCYFDTETTGIGEFRPATQRLVQLAWMLGDESHDVLIRDVPAISPEVPHPHTVADCLAKGVDFEAAFERFMADLRACRAIVAHNLAFDRGVMEHELRMRGVDGREFAALLEEKGRCTMETTTELCRLPSKFGKKFKFPQLQELYQHLFRKPPNVELHDALNDTAVLRDCYLELVRREVIA